MNPNIWAWWRVKILRKANEAARDRTVSVGGQDEKTEGSGIRGSDRRPAAG